MSLLGDSYSGPLARALLLQLVMLVVCVGCVLDLGETGEACAYSSVAFWCGTLIILIRRPAKPTPGDLFYIRWGLVFINLIGIQAFHTVWRLKGVI